MPRPDPTPAEPTAAGTYTVRLPHWHGGVEHPAGTTITGLRPAQIERIRAAEDVALAAAEAEVTRG